jgi:predicted nucleic acid-binding protein
VILADSSVLIEWQRMPSIQLYQIMTRYHAGICGVTIAEVLGGARNPQEREKSVDLFSSFAQVPIEPPVWELAGDISARLRVQGTPVMLADLVIAATAIHHHLPLWTRDNHFERVRVVAPALAIFDASQA